MVTNQIIALVNQARQQQGLQPVVVNPKLSGVAQALADDLAARGQLSHADSQGRNIGQRFMAANYVYAAAVEAVAAGTQTPEETVREWLNTPGNRDVVLNPAVTDAGVGYVFRPDQTNNRGLAYYWVLDLGSAVESGPGP